MSNHRRQPASCAIERFCDMNFCKIRVERAILILVGLALCTIIPPATADLITKDLVRTVGPGVQQLVFEPAANDQHLGGVPFEVISASNVSCPGVVSLDADLGTVNWRSTEAVTEDCRIAYTVRSETNETESGSIFLWAPDKGSLPSTGDFAFLDQRRRQYLATYLELVQQEYDGQWEQNPPGLNNQTCSDSIGTGQIPGVAAAPNGQRTHWDLILALLGIHDLGLAGPSDLPFGLDALETARRIMRYQHCLNPGTSLGGETLKLGTRNTVMRIFFLYKDTLFPNGGGPGTPNHDLYTTLSSRMVANATKDICTYPENPHFGGTCNSASHCHGGTENHCALFNSFRLLSAQLAGISPSNPLVVQRNEEVIRFLQHTVQYGFQEWGSGYQEWTWAGILNLAEFAEDPAVRRFAQMALDYNLAVQLTQSGPQGGFASGAIRAYPWDLYDKPTWQTLVNQMLFSGQDPTPASVTRSAAHFAVSNYAPLQTLVALFQENATQTGASRTGQRGYIRSRNKTYSHQNYRGPTYDLAANPRKARDTYGDYETLVAFVKADRDATSHGLAIGFNPNIPEAATDASTHRAETSRKSRRSFLHRNVILYTEGGEGCADGVIVNNCPTQYQPPRFYLTPDFQVTLQSGWAFATNEASPTDDTATYLGWRCATGSAVVDTASQAAGPPGTFLKSTWIPGTTNWKYGETCALEAGSRAELGGFSAFKTEVLSRSQFTGTQYRARNGSGGVDVIDYLGGSGTTFTFKVNGQNETPDEATWPRVEAPGFSVEGDDQSGWVFRITAGSWDTRFFLDTGSTEGGEREPSHWAFGAGWVPPQTGDTTAPTVGIRAPHFGQVASGYLEVEGYTLDENGVNMLRFFVDGVEIPTRFFQTDINLKYFCDVNPDISDPRCPLIGYRAWLDTSGLTNGKHLLRVMAVDPDGNEGILDHEFHAWNHTADPILPFIRDSFRPLTGTPCARSGSLDGSCLEEGDQASRWRSANLKFQGQFLKSEIGAAAGVPATGWAFVPVVANEVTDGTTVFNDPRNTVAGLERLIARVVIKMDASASISGEADWVGVGFHSTEEGADSLFLRVNRDGTWQIVFKEEPAPQGVEVVLAQGVMPTAAGFNPTRATGMELDYNLETGKVRGKVNAQYLNSWTLVPGGRTRVNEAGFFIDPIAQLNGPTGGYLVHRFEVLGDVIASGPRYRNGTSSAEGYYLTKPAARSTSAAMARSLGGYLSTINDLGEQNWVRDQWNTFLGAALGLLPCGTTVVGETLPVCGICDIGAPGIDGLWIGLSRPDGAAWTSAEVGWDGDDSAYRNWFPGQPLTTHVCDGLSQPATAAAMPFVIPNNTSARWYSWRDAATVAVSGVVEVENDP